MLLRRKAQPKGSMRIKSSIFHKNIGDLARMEGIPMEGMEPEPV
jgi:hypothetical protein